MTGQLGRFHFDERGQVMVLVALFFMGLVTAVGLVTDGGMVFAQRRDLQNVADAAARAGAMEIDEEAYRTSGGALVVLEERGAYETAREYLEAESDLAYVVRVGARSVEIAVARQASTAFLRVIGIRGVQITASALGRPVYGVASPAP